MVGFMVGFTLSTRPARLVSLLFLAASEAAFRWLKRRKSP